MYQLIETISENHIGTIILNDPKKMNALSQPMASEIIRALSEFRFDENIRVIVFRGAGGRFCAGGDITSMKKRVDAYTTGVRPETETKTNMENLNRVILLIRKIEKPVLAWIEGACAGGGLSIAMACDFSFAEEDTKMTCAFVNVGLAPDMGSTLMMLRRVGPVCSSDLFMTGRRFTGKQASELGIITAAFPKDELENAVMTQTKRLAAGPTLAYAEIKAAINRINYSEMYSCMTAEADCADRLTHTADHAEAVNAFLEKRKPEFTGK